MLWLNPTPVYPQRHGCAQADAATAQHYGVARWMGPLDYPVDEKFNVRSGKNFFLTSMRDYAISHHAAIYNIVSTFYFSVFISTYTFCFFKQYSWP